VVSVAGGPNPAGPPGLGPAFSNLGDAQVAPGTVACGTTTCDAATEICCTPANIPGAPTQMLACTAPGSCSYGGGLSCSSAASCDAGEVCCFMANNANGALEAGGVATCRTACMAGDTQLCTTSTECPSGETCQETGGPLPQVCQLAPSSAGCVLTFSPQGATSSSPGECTVELNATCGNNAYQASCACPEGTCACFGSLTSVIHFEGCPFCPGSEGVTSAAEVFALCGVLP